MKVTELVAFDCSWLRECQVALASDRMASSLPPRSSARHKLKVQEEACYIPRCGTTVHDSVFVDEHVNAIRY